jgi:hypothetical protein
MDDMARMVEHRPGSCWLRGYHYAPKVTNFTLVQWLVSRLFACLPPDKEITYVLDVICSAAKAHIYKTIRSLRRTHRDQ